MQIVLLLGGSCLLRERKVSVRYNELLAEECANRYNFGSLCSAFDGHWVIHCNDLLPSTRRLDGRRWVDPLGVGVFRQ